MPPPAQVLAQLPLFADLTACELADIIAVLRDGQAGPGTALIREGDPPGTPLTILLEGAAAIVKWGADGRAHTVSTVRAPAVVGERDVLASRPAQAGVVALEPVVFATLSAADIASLCAAARPCMLKVLNNLAAVLRYRTQVNEASLRRAAGSALGPLRRLLYGGWDSRRSR